MGWVRGSSPWLGLQKGFGQEVVRSCSAEEPGGKSLNLELSPGFVTAWRKGIYFCNCCLSSVFWEELSQRDLSSVCISPLGTPNRKQLLSTQRDCDRASLTLRWTQHPHVSS